MAFEATVIEDSISDNNVRITTLQLKYPRMVLAETNTHRMFCLGGDSLLEFELPNGSSDGKYKRVFTMRLDKFVEKWHNGASERPNKPRKDLDYSLMVEDIYTTKQLSQLYGFSSTGFLNKAARDGNLKAVKVGKPGRWSWVVQPEDFIIYWSRPTVNRQNILSRLRQMRIRQYNEDTGRIQLSTVTDCWFSGIKEVFAVKAEGFMIKGSEDHRILTENGWKTVKQLVPGKDRLVIRKFGKHENDLLNPDRFKKIKGEWRSRWQIKVKNILYDRQEGNCFFCKSDNPKEVHHIIPVYENSSLAFDLNNVVLVCESCHKKQHEIQGWQGGTYLYGDFATVNDITSCGEEPTYDLEISGDFPNFLANGVVVHNSRNASSSRAIPVQTLLKRVREEPAMPAKWGKNQKGMQAGEFFTSEDIKELERDWLHLRDIVAYYVEDVFVNKWGLHKQLANRPLETWMHCYQVITATEWDNFMNLRCHPDAQPEINAIALEMRRVMEESTPMYLEPGAWHLPYVQKADHVYLKGNIEKLIKVSVARCARVSYKTHDGSRPRFEEDLILHDGLLSSGHMCYDRKTEVLTKTGWSFWNEITEEDELASFNLTNESIRFEKPQKFHRNEYHGKMYHVKTRKIDLLVTPNHNMVVKKRGHDRTFSPFCLESAESIFGKERHYCSAGNLENSLRRPIKKPDEWLCLIGFFIGDGSISSTNTIVFHLKKKRKIKYLCEIAEVLGLEVRNSGNKYRLTVNTDEFSSCYNENKEKVLPKFCMSLPKEQVMFLLEGLRNSDGSSKYSSWLYCTTSEELKDQLQILGVLNGFYFHEIHTHMGEDRYCYRMYFSENIKPEVSPRYRGKPESWVDFSGEVFCATVSTGALVVRRNGKVVISGNSPLEHAARAEVFENFVGNFRGWTQYRKTIPEEDVFQFHEE